MEVGSCPVCHERDGIIELQRLQIAALLEQVGQLQAQVLDLQARLGQNSRNSSLPPSANPLGAPKPVVKKPTGRRPGGQPGHVGHSRVRLPPDRVQHTKLYIPTTCSHCQAPLPATGTAADPEPTWHQVMDLPEPLVEVTEHQGQARTCGRCDRVTYGEIPAAVRAHVIGPRLASVMAYLSGCLHVSRRGVQEFVTTLGGVPVALGTVVKLEEDVSAALAAAHAEAQAAVQAAPIKHADETGWKQAGRRCCLWLAATTQVAVFLLYARRSLEGLTRLLGQAIQGIVITDRYAVYECLRLAQRQVCWAHLKRDFQKCLDRGGTVAARVGGVGLMVVEAVFERWYTFRGGGCDRPALQRYLEPVQQLLHESLEAGSKCADAPLARFCANLLALEPALWTFAAVDGVEPTNNHAERLLRPAVLWRKNAFGSHSEAGCRFTERMLTVVQTLRLQKRAVFHYLSQALQARRAGLQPPPLLT
jgi:transposase